jgi:hypothetical protein
MRIDYLKNLKDLLWLDVLVAVIHLDSVKKQDELHILFVPVKIP